MKTSIESGEHPATTVAPSKAAPSALQLLRRIPCCLPANLAPSEWAASALQRPEFFRLPKSGGDPYFGFGRSYYYEGEQRGYWKLVRIRERGKLRGITLIPYDAVLAFVRKHMEAGE